MERTLRVLMEARYIISLHKNIPDLVSIIKEDEKTIYNDINIYLKEYDKELYERVINILEKC